MSNLKHGYFRIKKIPNGFHQSVCQIHHNFFRVRINISNPENPPITFIKMRKLL